MDVIIIKEDIEMKGTKRFPSALLTAALLASFAVGCAQQESTSPQETADTADNGMSAAAALLADIPTTQAFTEEAVAEADIDQIISAGINAPSAMNGQPWHFSVVTDAETLQHISEDMSGGMGGRPSPMPELSAENLPETAENTGSSPRGLERKDEAGDTETIPPAPSGSAGLAKAGISDAPLAIVISCKAGSEFDAGLACQNMSAEAQLLGYGTKIISSPTIALNGAQQDAYRELLGIPEDQSAVAVLLVGRDDTSLDADAVTAATTRDAASELVTKVS